MGQVFQCWDLQLHRWCAVKLMGAGLTARPALRRQFASEARTLAQLAHRHVVQIFDLVDDVPHPYLVTEYLEGGSTEQLPHPLHPHHAATVCAQVARALEAAHLAGLIHRDVKPANILLERGGVAKLGDFGLAMLRGAGRQGVAGTPGFMAPEQASAQASPLSDVFSLGATLFAMLRADPPEGLRTSAREALLEPVPELLRPIVRRATQPEPSDRGTAAELAEALERAAQRLTSRDLGPLPIRARPPVEQPSDRPCPVELVEMLAGTRAEPGGATAIHEVRLAPALLTEPELGRCVLRVEVRRGQSERLLQAARTLERARGPGVPEVLSTGPAPGGGRWVTLRHDAAAEPLEAYASRLSPARRASWLLPLARRVGALVASAHAHGVAHGALGDEQPLQAQVWIRAGEVALVSGWGGEQLLGLVDQNRERFRADVEAVARLYQWCAGERLPHRLRQVVERARSGVYPDLVAFEGARAQAEREGRLGALAGRALVGAMLLLGAAGIGVGLGLALVVQALLAPAPVPPPVPVAAVPREPSAQEQVDRLLQAGARLEEVTQGSCEEHRPPSISLWIPLSATDSFSPERYGPALMGAGSPDQVRGVFVTPDWVVVHSGSHAARGRATYAALGPVREPRWLAANDRWIAVAGADGGVSVLSPDGAWRTELPAAGRVTCLVLDEQGVTVGRADGAMERWRLQPGVRRRAEQNLQNALAEGQLGIAPLPVELGWSLEGGQLVRSYLGQESIVADDVVAYLPVGRDVAAVTNDGALLLWTERLGAAVRLPLPSPVLGLSLRQDPLRLEARLTDHVLEIDGCVLEIAAGEPSCASVLAPQQRW
jgi:tRNA A-37 threonylcarbamoyl transferase component Bud32